MGRLGQSESVIRFQGFELNPQTGELWKNGIRLKLQDQPFKVLVALLQHPGQVVTREELRQLIWPEESFGDFDHAINRSITKLRGLLGDSPDVPHLIETLPRRGYRFIGSIEAPVKERAGTEPISVITTPTIADTSRVLEPPPQESPASASVAELVDSSRVPRRWRTAVTTAASVFTLALLGVAIYRAASLPPMPRIMASHVLTKTGYPKQWRVSPIVDRGSVYFDEQRPAGWVTSQVSSAGGELGSLKLSCCLADISRDGSEELWDVDNPKHKSPDAWVQPVPSGTPRLLIEDACSSRWSADGRSLFFARNNCRELYRANADGTGVERLATIPGIAHNPHLSPDGSRIRFTGEFPGYPLWEVGANGSNPHPILSGYEDVWGGTWSTDGKYYFFAGWDGDQSSLWVVSESRHWWTKANTSTPRQLTFGPLAFGSPGISKDGAQLYAVGTQRRGELSAYDSNVGKFVPYLGGESICMVDFSRDGQWIAYVTYPEGTLWRSRIDGSERRQLTVPPMAVLVPRWSPDGKLIVFQDNSNGDRRKMTFFGPTRIYAVSANGGAPAPLLAGYVGDAKWSPDGKSITYFYFRYPASEVRILDLQSQKSTTFPGSQGMWSPRWSPDGKYLVAMAGKRPNFEQKLMLFSFASNTWVELASSDGGFGWPSWSHDSKFVYAQDGDSVVRIAIATHKKEQIASLKGLHATSYYFDRVDYLWLGLTPDDRPLITRDTGIQELYAFDLNYK